MTKITRRAFQASMAALPAAVAGGSPQQQQQQQQQGKPIRIVTTYQFEPFEGEKIKSTAATPVEIIMCNSREEFRKQLREADVVYGSFTSADLDYAPRVKWVQSGAAGMEWMDDKFRQTSFILTNYARVFAPGITETAMGLLLCLTRGLSKNYMPQFAKRQMKPVGTVKSADHVELVGRTMAIVGMGGIGSTLARRAYYGFDMNIIATDAKP